MDFLNRCVEIAEILAEHPYGQKIVESIMADQDYVLIKTKKRAVMERLKNHFSYVSVQVKRKGLFKRKIYVVKCYYL